MGELYCYSKVSIIRPGHSRLLGFEKKDSSGHLIETFSKIQTRTFNRDSRLVHKKQDDHFFLRWTWSFNRDFLEKFRLGRLIEQDA